MNLTVSERDFQDAVIDLATRTRWRVAHFRPARVGRGDNQRWVTPMQGHTGWPDLVMAKSGVILYRELKRHGANPTPEQKAWGRAIAPHWPYCTYLDYEVTLPNGERAPRFEIWRPGDWDLIVATLTGKNAARTA